MKPTNLPDNNGQKASEMVADALLTEHARLGTRDDEELIARILLETVEKPSAVTPLPAQRTTKREWLQLGTAVAACVAAIILILSNLTISNPKDPVTFHVTVAFYDTQSGPVSVAPDSSKVDEQDTPVSRESIPPAKRVDHSLPPLPENLVVSSMTVQDQDFNLITQFETDSPVFPAKEALEETLTVTAEETEMSGNELIYRGDVTVTHRDFVIRASEVRVSSGEASGTAPALVAKIADVTHFASSSKASVDTAIYDMATGTLSGYGVHSFSRAGEPRQISPDPAGIVEFKEKIAAFRTNNLDRSGEILFTR